MTLERVDGLALQLHALIAVQRSESVERLAGAVDDAAEQSRADAHAAGALPRNHARARREAVHIAGGHHEQLVAGEADHFGFTARAVTGNQVADVADRGLAAGRFQREAHHARQRTFDGGCGQIGRAGHLRIDALAPRERALGTESRWRRS